MTTHDEIEKVTTELDELGASWAHVHHRVLAREAAALIRRLRDERDEVRTILASADIAALPSTLSALPNDYSLAQMAQARMDTLKEAHYLLLAM